jgi:hypothetical protein
MSEVLPRAIKKYGGIDADALRKAALEVDVPEGGTMLGFGVRFLGDGPMAGQNERAFPIIVQYVDDKASVVWPKSLQLREPLPSARRTPRTDRPPGGRGHGRARPGARRATTPAPAPRRVMAPPRDFCYGPRTLAPFGQLPTP